MVDPEKLAVLVSLLGGILIMCSGLLLMLNYIPGFVRAAKKVGITGVVLLGMGLAPVEFWQSIVELFSRLPVWPLRIAGVFIVALIGIRLIGIFAAIFIGKEASWAMMGNLGASTVKGLFSIIFSPIKYLRKYLRGSDE